MIITLYINAKPAETWNYLPMDHVYTITITNIRKNAKFLNKYNGVIIAIPPFLPHLSQNIFQKNI